MSFNPLEQAGIPVEDQFRNWSELNVTPYDKGTVDPYTRTRVILMNGIEVESIIFSHQFARHTDHPELKRALATSRRVDAQQQKAVNGLNPGDQSPLETTIGYEQVAVDLTAWLARHEPDPMVHQALDFALLEDFDHLYRYSDLYDLLYGGRGRRDHPAPDRDHAGTPDGRRTPAPARRDPHALRDPHRGPADPDARHDHRGGRAADHELLHEPRERLGRADRPRPLRGDRAHRGAARHPLRVAARPARLVARDVGVPRVQRGLHVLVDAAARERPAHQGPVGAAPQHGAGPAPGGLRLHAAPRGPRAGRDAAADPARTRR